MRIPAALVLLVALAPAVVFADEEESLVYFTASDLPWLLGMALFFVLLIGGAIWYFLRGYSSFSETTSVVEMAFEKELLNEVESGKVTTSEPLPSAKPIVLPPPAPAKPTAPVPFAPPEKQADSSAPATGIDDLARRLQQLTILADREGIVQLPVEPHGAIYRLRTGGTALLLPRLEAMRTLGHFTKRFDVVIIAPEDGAEPIVISRLQTRLRDLMERPGDFDAPSL